MINDLGCPAAGKHRDLDAAQAKKSERAVQNVMTAIPHFTNSWRTPNKENLFSLSSRAPVPADVEVDVHRADTVGKTLKEDFIQNRLGYASEKCFFDTLKRQKLRSMEDNNKKVSLTTSQGKLIQYQEQINLAFKLLVKSQMEKASLNLDTLMGYSLSLVQHCLGTVDGFFAKSNKASMMHFTMEDHSELVAYPKDAMFIQDGNALFHTMTNLAPAFRGIALQLLGLMLPKRDFVFSTESYRLGSIKSQERLRRECGEQFLLDGSATRKPKDFKKFLTNAGNKRQLCKLILDMWSNSSAAAHLQKCNSVVLVKDDKAHKLHARNGQVRSSLLVVNSIVKSFHYW